MAPDNARLMKAAAREGGELDAGDACALFAAMLAGELAPRELSAILTAWQTRRASLAEITGFMRALDAHTARLEMPRDRPRPVVLPAFHGTHRQANLTALLALLLQRYQTPVLVHGQDGVDAAVAGGDVRSRAGPGASSAGAPPAGPSASPVTTAQVLWELGIEPAASPADAQARLWHDGIAYVPLAVLAPDLARLLASPPSSLPEVVHSVAMLVDPFAGDGYRVVGAASADELAGIREFLVASRNDALLLSGTEGEPFADPRGQTSLEHVAGGVVTLCGDAEAEGIKREPSLPAASDAASTATWIANVLAGTEPVPPPIVVQLGCCLAGARRIGTAG
jgi:anthranilate phosphoribosyltransferase